MTPGPEIHRRRSLRLSDYDYAQAGAYFVTICTQDRQSLFGEILDSEMRLNEAGQMVEQWWRDLGQKYTEVEIDEFVIMPNHVHGVVVLIEHEYEGGHIGPPLRTVIQWFKTMTTNEYIRAVKQSGWQRFLGRLWQRSYYEHIIRNEDDLDRIRQYIADNPARWAEDSENPLHGNGR